MTLMFGSDNAAGVSREILAALQTADEGYALAYGGDQWSKRLNKEFSEFFEHDCFVFPVTTGTAANALALAAITPPYGEIFCHERAHIYTTECGAPEFYCGGARLVTGAGEGGKLSTAVLDAYLAGHRTHNPHHMLPAALSLTQATEYGTVYSEDEIAALSAIAHAGGMKVHMDGARFANALVSLHASPASLTWRSGVDVLSLGTTKNGTMNAEAVIVFDADLAKAVAVRHKRAGLLTSKMRYLSVQLAQMLKNGLWERNARTANDAATRLAAILCESGHARLQHPVQTNQLFVELDEVVTQALEKADIEFRRWGPGVDRAPCFRLVTSFCTTENELDLVRYALASNGPSALQVH